MEKEFDIQKQFDIAVEIYKNISQQIQFLYTKVALLLAWQAANVGFLIKIIYLSANKPPNDKFQLLSLLFILYSILTFCSIIYSFRTLKPRLKDKQCIEKCMFWVYHISCGKFNEDLQRFKKNISDFERVLDCLSRSIVSSAEVLKEKYSFLQRSIKFFYIATFVEMLIFGLLFLFHNIYFFFIAIIIGILIISRVLLFYKIVLIISRVLLFYKIVRILSRSGFVE